ATRAWQSPCYSSQWRLIMLHRFRPSDTTDEVYTDPTERERALRYSRIHEWLVLIDLIFGSLVNVLALTTGLSARLRDQAERLAPRKLGPAMPFAAIGLMLSFLASLPLSYFSGYVIEHRYE